MKLYLTFILFLSLNSGWVMANAPELNVVEDFNVKSYLGKWYEIASYPQWFQKDCNATTAIYTLLDSGDIEVKNSCHKKSVDGKLSEAIGKAWIDDEVVPAKLKVQFFMTSIKTSLFAGDYWVIMLHPNYQYAVVSDPKRKTLWILSRTPRLEEVDKKVILAEIKEKGFDLEKLKWTQHKAEPMN